MAVNSYQGLARKYRPQNFAEMVGQDAAARGIAESISENRVVHGHILTGPRGVGKTTSARILARCLNCDSGPTPTPCGKCKHCVAITAGNDMDVIEFDAASNTKVEQMRDLLERVMLAPFAARNKVYIIDEVHMLSTGAFNALLKTLEEPPSQVYFIFATTEFEKIPETIRSRCAIHAFRRLTAEDIVRRLGEVIKAEGLESETPAAREVFALVAQMAEGGMRDALVALDQILAVSGGTLDPVAAQRVLGLSSHATLAKTVEALTAGDAAAILAIIEELVSRGLSLERFIKALLAFMHEIMLIQSGAKEDLLTLTGEMLDRMRLMAKDLPRVSVFNMIHQLFDLEEKLKRSTQSRFLVEFTFLRMAVVKPVVPIDQLISRLQALPDGAPVGATLPASAPAPASAAAHSAPPPIAVAAPISAPAPTPAPAPSPFAPEPPPAPRKPAPRPVPARQVALNDYAAAPSEAPAAAPQSTGPNPLAGLDREEIITLLGAQMTDAQQFLLKYLKTCAGFRVEANRLWIQWPTTDFAGPRTMGKAENIQILQEILQLVCGRPMTVENETSTAAPPPAAAAPAPAPRAAARPSLNDGWGDPEDTGFGMENPFLLADYQRPAAPPAPTDSGHAPNDLPQVDAEGVRAVMAGNSELARRAKMVRDFFDGTFIDTAGTPLAI